MDGGGRGRLGGEFLEGFTEGNLINTYPKSTQIRNSNRPKSMEIRKIDADHLVDWMMIL